MKHALPGILRQLALLLALCLVLGGGLALHRGEPSVLGAWLLGLGAAAVCIWTMVYRTWRSASLSVGAAKAQMLWGLILRLFVIGAAFFFAARGGRAALLLAVGGFLSFYAAALALFVRSALKISEDETAPAASEK